MMIDDLYSEIDKNNFYLGLVSQVYKNSCVVQIENLSWLSLRRINQELLIPNTINYYVVIDSALGLFIGEVYQSKMPSSDSVHFALKNNFIEKVFPELSIDVIGLMKNEDSRFRSTGFYAVGLTEKVYLANKTVNRKYLESIENARLEQDYLQNKLSSFAKVANMGYQDIRLSPETIFDRHLMAVGSTNSGKSTTSLSIIDKLLLDRKKILIIDPTGEYSNSFVEESVTKLNLGINTVLNPGKVTFSQWATLFETNDTTQPAVLADAIKSLRYQYKAGNEGVYIKKWRLIVDVLNDMASLTPSDTSFDLSLLPKQITEEAVESDKNMEKYQTGSFQFNNKQWLVQKVDFKLNNIN